LNPEEGACAAEWLAYEQAEDRKAKKEAEEAAEAAKSCPRGQTRWCDQFCMRGRGGPGIGRCVRTSGIRIY